jgi:hypothetical protein
MRRADPHLEYMHRVGGGSPRKVCRTPKVDDVVVPDAAP